MAAPVRLHVDARDLCWGWVIRSTTPSIEIARETYHAGAR